MRSLPPLLGVAAVTWVLVMPAGAADRVIDAKLHHLRFGAAREWDDCPAQAEGDSLRVTFEAKANPAEWALRLRHRDLRHGWKLALNGKVLTTLGPENDDMLAVVPVPPGALKDGQNVLELACAASGPIKAYADDAFIGAFELLEKPRKEAVSGATLELSLEDGDGGQAIPGRFTIVDGRGCLVPLGTPSSETLAVRTGVVYAAGGKASVALPPGQYTVYAGRGFEWGMDKADVQVEPGKTAGRAFRIRREVDTKGWVASDPHVHTFTYSKHGDCTMAERMITLAGEGIEFPVATDHNLQISYDDAASAMGLRGFFTPVVGNEVTTPRLGHFNVLPLDGAAKVIDFRLPTWARLFDEFDAVAPGGVVILNHARDVHGGFRPFDPSRHVSLSGEGLDGWDLRITGMEVLNSGATTVDPLILFRDWLGLLNAGKRVCPIGASDSHDVSRYIVGQGRTYIRCGDGDAGKIDIKSAVAALRAGKVSVSYGLFVEMTVNGTGPGETAAAPAADLDVRIAVKGPAWLSASRVELYANGEKVREAPIPAEDATRPGTKLDVAWRLPRPKQDVALVALVMGPGLPAATWPNAKPYQPTGSNWKGYALACTGATFVDADGSGTFESPHETARRLIEQAKDEVPALLARLADYDAATVIQAASLLRKRPALQTPEALAAATRSAPPKVAAAVRSYLEALAQSQAAREKAAAKAETR